MHLKDVLNVVYLIPGQMIWSWVCIWANFFLKLLLPFACFILFSQSESAALLLNLLFWLMQEAYNVR